MIARRPFLLCAAAASLPILDAWGDTRAAAGVWHAVLTVGAQRLRLKLEIADSGATLTSLDQGGGVILASRVAVDGARVRLAFESIGASFHGELRNDRLVGEWRQDRTAPLVFTREPPAVTPLTRERFIALRVECGAPAMAAAAAHRDGRQISFADGVRAEGRRERVTDNDRWHIGSITKSMTATLAAQCVEAGVISWDDTVFSVLGQAVPSIRPEHRDVTLRHLLSHRSGLQANFDSAAFASYPSEGQDARASRIDYARRVLEMEPVGPKEATFLYSNGNFIIAGAMLEAKAGAPWETLMAERLFAPLGMAGAGFGAPGTQGRFDEPVGHAPAVLARLSPHPPGALFSDNPTVLGPAGRVHARCEDMLKFLAAHRDRTALLRAESWSVLHTPPFGGDYAMGWVKRGDMLWHNGSNTLWYAEASFDPVSGVTAVAAVNDGRVSAVYAAVSTTLADIAQGFA